MVVAELPASIGPGGGVQEETPPEQTAASLTSTPRARDARAVAATSAPGPRWDTRLVPEAMPASSRARWDSDLSPGTAGSARNDPAGKENVLTGASCHVERADLVEGQRAPGAGAQGRVVDRADGGADQGVHRVPDGGQQAPHLPLAPLPHDHFDQRLATLPR